jgi:RNA polymerase subunit RPABC4/transcription elongation factor Spt4
MTECIEQSWLFQELGTRNVEVDFGGGYLSSDGGGLILREFEHHSGLLRDFFSEITSFWQRSGVFMENDVCPVCATEIEVSGAHADVMVDHGTEFEPIEITGQKTCPKCGVSSVTFSSGGEREATSRRSGISSTHYFMTGKGR